MHDERCMHLRAERDGSGFAGGQKGFVECEHVFLPAPFLGLVSVTLLLGGWLVSSSIFIANSTIKLCFLCMGKLLVFVYACMQKCVKV